MVQAAAAQQGQDLPESADLVVLGSGVAGLTAALVGARAGLDVVVLEHTGMIGGTSARSSGTVWVPDNHYMQAKGMHGDREKAEAYLAALVADRGEAAMWRAFLDAAPAMLRDLTGDGTLAFRPFMQAPDYRQDMPGAAPGGRALEPVAFDGRRLGADFARLAWPLPELMLFARMMVTRAEAGTLVRADRSPAALTLGARLMARYLADRLAGWPRGTRLVLGNALVGRLLWQLQRHGGRVFTGVAGDRLVKRGPRVVGVCLQHGGGRKILAARCGVVLAGGGFPASAEWRQKHLPRPTPEHSPAYEGCTGRTIELGLAAGAALGPSGLDNAQWFPSSLARRRDGSLAVYPHIVLDRGKPGLIAVNHAGRRFVSEAVSYHEFVRAMYRTHRDSPAIPAWLICDRDFIRKYGLGLIRPRTPFIGRHVRSGYLKTGRDARELAGAIGVPADNLAATIARFNRFAAQGRDEDFHKGENIYEQAAGDPAVRPNPCLGPLGEGRLYAVAVHPTPLGTSRGLAADPQGRVLGESGRPIPGLYVCGNDMQSAFGGEYPGAGGQLAQGMTFGWLAARHAATSRNAKATPARRRQKEAT